MVAAVLADAQEEREAIALQVLPEQIDSKLSFRESDEFNVVFATAHNPLKPRAFFHQRVSMVARDGSDSKVLDLICNDESFSFLRTVVHEWFGQYWDGWKFDECWDVSGEGF